MPPDTLPITAEQQGVLAIFFGEWAVYIFLIIVAVIFKETIQNALDGVRVFWGSDLNEDDIVVLDGEPARVVRVGYFKTSFYMYRIDAAGVYRNGTRLGIANSKLDEHRIEKPLPLFDAVLIEIYKNRGLKPIAGNDNADS